jgi:hypothetical protein
MYPWHWASFVLPGTILMIPTKHPYCLDRKVWDKHWMSTGYLQSMKSRVVTIVQLWQSTKFQWISRSKVSVAGWHLPKQWQYPSTCCCTGPHLLCWRRLDGWLGTLSCKCLGLTATGVMVVIPDLRSYPQDTVPEMFWDVDESLQWTMDHITEYEARWSQSHCSVLLIT